MEVKQKVFPVLVNRYKLSVGTSVKIPGGSVMKGIYSFIVTLVLIIAAVSVFGAFPLGEFKILNPIFENEDLKVIFAIGEAERAKVLALRIYNKTNQLVSIIWDESLITDNHGQAVRPIHSGIKFLFVDRPQVPTIIPPKGYIDEVMIPRTHVYYSNGWHVEPLSEKRLERFFLISYKVGETEKKLSGTVQLSYTSPQPQKQLSYTPPKKEFSKKDIVEIIIGLLFLSILAWLSYVVVL